MLEMDMLMLVMGPEQRHIISLSGGQEETITTDVFSFPCYQFPFVFTHINKWIQKHTRQPSFSSYISSIKTHEPPVSIAINTKDKSALLTLGIPIKHLYVTIMGWGQDHCSDHGPVTSLP